MNDDEIKQLLKEILKWQRLQGIEILKNKIKEEKLLQEKKCKIVYHFCDGEKSSRDLGRIVNMSHVQVQKLWKKWINSGIAEAIDKYRKSRCKKLFELNEFGLELPEIKKE